MALDRAGLLALSDLERREVSLPGGQTVFVRVMTVAERDRLANAVSGDVAGRLRPYTIAACACDAEGTALFSQADAEAIGRLPFRVADAIFDAASDLNRISEEAKEDLGKDSALTPTSGG